MVTLPEAGRKLSVRGDAATRRRAQRALTCAEARNKVSELRVCTNNTCKKQGSPEVLKVLESLELDEAGIKVVSCGCLGQCGRGPNAVALPNGQLAFGLGRDLDTWTALQDLWNVEGVDEKLYRSVLLRLEGNKCAQSGDFTQAREKYKEALDLAPEHVQHAIHSNLSLVALSVGDPQEALHHAEAALSLAPPDWTTAKIRVAEACIALGDGSRAAAAIEQALRNDSTFRRTPLFKSLATRINALSCA